MGSEQTAQGNALGMWATQKRPERAKALLCGNNAFAHTLTLQP